MIKIKSLKNQIAILSTASVVITSVCLLFIFWWSSSQYNFHQISKQMQSAESVLIEYLSAKEQVLTTSAKVLTADFGFKQAIATQDVETIQSVLDNHAARIEADLMILMNTNGELVSNNLGSKIDAKMLGDAFQGNTNQQSSAQFIYLEGVLYEVIMLPIKAPHTVGYCIIGFAINNTFLTELKRLTTLDVSFTDIDNNWIFSSADNLQELNAQIFNSDFIAAELFVERPQYINRLVTLNQAKNITIILSSSMQEIYKEFDTLVYFIVILSLTIVVLAIILSSWLSKNLVNPINDLVRSTRLFAKGEYEIQPLNHKVNQEVKTLHESFEKMGSEISLREHKIKHQARHDKLTDLFNRQTVIEELDVKLRSNQPRLVIAINIRGFRRINDVLGASIGDKVLQSFALELPVFLSASNCHFEDAIYGRVGGDEFLLSIPIEQGIAEEVFTENFITTLIQYFDKELSIGNLMINTRLRLGVLKVPEHGNNAEDLLRRANIAIDAARAESLSVRYYQNGEEENYLARLKIIEELKLVLQNPGNSLFLVYQPKLNLSTGEIDKVEALIRWQDSSGNFVSPELFVSLAEQSGLIISLTQWVIKEALSQIQKWKTLDIQLKVAINVSAQDLSHPQFIDFLLSSLSAYEVDSNQITIELTERDIMQNEDLIVHRLQQLKKMGTYISVDDYGIGQSSLAKLKQLPIDELKIDKSFILELNTSHQDKQIVSSTINLGHKLGLNVVAEGVENKESLDLLKKYGCNHAQGYHLSRPVKANELVTWLESQ
ncbi:EAL domain-containing protein [Pleionea litopenaei]|uniref:bifunctional diguanylate cyclase/phosphodiesterase n=1 Tax=Pleionea litopenaei TaxID=3070815 RepID=UPI003F4964E7